MRTAEAFQKHWCLVFVAYSFLHLDCLPASSPKRSSLARPSKPLGGLPTPGPAFASQTHSQSSRPVPIRWFFQGGVCQTLCQTATGSGLVTFWLCNLKTQLSRYLYSQLFFLAFQPFFSSRLRWLRQRRFSLYFARRFDIG